MIMSLSLDNAKGGWIERTWMRRFCHLARRRYFLSSKGESPGERKRNLTSTLSV